MHVFGGQWEEARVPRGNPHKHRENIQTPHRKAPIWGFVLFFHVLSDPNRRNFLSMAMASNDGTKFMRGLINIK